MTPETTPGPDGVAHDLPARVAQAVLDTPGVVRIEPPLTRALARLGRPGAGRADDRAEVGAVDLQHAGGPGDGVDVGVDLVIDAHAAALTTTRAVRAAVTSTITDAGLVPGRITVAVLGVDRG